MQADNAPLAMIPLTITQSAFRLAKRGDDKLLRVLLGPTIQAEKALNIQVNAKIDTLNNQQRLYAFMRMLTEARLAVIGEFKQVHPDYRNFETLNKKLSEVTGRVISAAVKSLGIVGDVHQDYCVELNDQPLIDLSLDIDPPSDLDLGIKRHSAEVKASSIKTFLLAQGLDINENASYKHLRLNKAILDGFKSVWFERFALRASGMMMDEILDDAALNQAEASLDDQFALYQRHEQQCNDEKVPLITQQDLLENNFIQRCHQQKQWIEEALADSLNPLDAECEAFIRKAHILLSFTMREEAVMHLQGTPDEPQKSWLPFDVKDDNGNTLLHVAAENRRYRTVNALMKYGALLQVQNNEGKTPADLVDLDDAELANLAAKYSREKESDFLAAEKALITRYKQSADKILSSRWNRFWYGMAHNVDILKERVDTEIPALMQTLTEAYQDISDMNFALEVVRLRYEAKRGLLGKSRLHDQAFRLAMEYFMRPEFGVKLESEVEELMRITGMQTPQGKADFELQLRAKEAEFRKHFEKSLQLQGVVIANLQSENGQLKASLNQEIVTSSEKDKRIAEQDARIEQQSIELQTLKSTVEEQGNELKQTQAALKRMEAMMEKLLSREVGSELRSSPIPIPQTNVSNHASTVFGSSPSPSPTPASQEGDVHLQSFYAMNGV